MKTSYHFYKRYFRHANVEGISVQGGCVAAQMSYCHTGANVCPRCMGVLSIT